MRTQDSHGTADAVGAEPHWASTDDPTIKTLFREALQQGRFRNLPEAVAQDTAMKVVVERLEELMRRPPNSADDGAAARDASLTDVDISRRADNAARVSQRVCEHDRERRVALSDGGHALHLDGPPPESTLSPENIVLHREYLRVAIEAVDSDETARMLLERLLEERTLPEIGRRHGCSADCVRMRLKRAMERIKVEFARRGLDKTDVA